MQVFAPAKINLSLRVLKKRSDGFHDIETLMAPISLFDELEMEKQSRSIDFQCDDRAVPQGEDNLVVRAAKLFFESINRRDGVSIRLKKKIPHGAGLGGGSSDAASTLLALNELFATKLSREALGQMAAALGSDVPFFIFQSTAICRGRGELITPAKLPEPLSILLVKPGFGVPTESAYKRWEQSQEIPGINYRSQAFSNQSFVNDLERPVFQKFVFIAQTKMWLLRQPEVGAALMSGSGSTMFALMRPNTDVDLLSERAKEQLDPQLWTCGCETI